MENYSYQVIAKSLINFQLSDWRTAVREVEFDRESMFRKNMIAKKLTSLCYCDGFLVEEIIKLAEKRNQTFSFLSESIDLVKLEDAVNEELDKYKSGK